MRQFGLPRRRAFTLVEMLVVIAILGLLAALTAVAVQQARAAAVITACQNNLRQLALALQLSHDAQGFLPPGHRTLEAKPPKLVGSGWTLDTLPFIEQKPLWQAALAAYEESYYPYLVPPHTPLETVVKTFACSADGRAGQVQPVDGAEVALTSYQGVSGISGLDKRGVLFADSKVRMADVEDGTSNTLLLGERPPSSDFRYGGWYVVHGNASTINVFSLHLGVAVQDPWRLYAPATEIPPCAYSAGVSLFQPGTVDDPCALFRFWSPHGGGAYFACCDGSVRFLAYSTVKILPVLATRAGGEPVIGLD